MVGRGIRGLRLHDLYWVRRRPWTEAYRRELREAGWIGDELYDMVWAAAELRFGREGPTVHAEMLRHEGKQIDKIRDEDCLFTPRYDHTYDVWQIDGVRCGLLSGRNQRFDSPNIYRTC